MSDGQTIEQQATLMGWMPKENFRGNPETWVDAESFVEKGKHVLPILHKNNERLLGQVGTLTTELNALRAKIASQEASMEDFKTFHAEATKAQVAAARKEILEGLKAAKTEGDVDAEIEYTAQLSQFDAAQKAPPAAPVEGSKPAVPQVTELAPAFKAWQADNPWFGTDHARSGAAQGIANQLRAQGDTSLGLEFLNKVAQGVNELFGPHDSGTPPSKVESPRGSDGAGRDSGPVSYAKLPADARAVCDKQATRFVGPDKLFKTKAEWQSHYAKTYFGE